MAKSGPNYTALTHQVVRESPEPLTIDQITERVVALAGTATKNPKSTVRSAINQSMAIVALGDGRYGWKARLINGATHRMIVHDEDLLEREIFVDEALRDLLVPNVADRDKYGVKGPPAIELEGGPTLIVPVAGRGESGYRLDLGAPFWDWLVARGARPGDSLLLSAIDGEARRYRIRYEPQSARDEEAIRRRGEELIAAAVAIVRASKANLPIWHIVGLLNARGAFHHPIPPEPFEDLWTPAVWGPLVEEYESSPLLLGGFRAQLDDDFDEDYLGGPPLKLPISEDELPPGVTLEQLQARVDALVNSPNPPRVAPDDPLLPILTKALAAAGIPSPTGQPYQAAQLLEWFGDNPAIRAWIAEGITLGMVAPDPQFDELIRPGSPLAQVFDIMHNGPTDPPDLPKEYTRSGSRRPRPSAQGSKGPVKSYTLRVAYRYQPDFWRDIEIAADQNFEDLHLAIQKALGWDDDHLYSFYTGKHPFDQRTEIGSPWSQSARYTYQTTLGSLNLRKGTKLLYLFDYGDEHLFDIKVLSVNNAAPKGRYPKVVGRHGKYLEQYPDEDEDWYDDEEE